MGKSDLKLIITIIAVTLVIIIGGVLLFSKDAGTQTKALTEDKLIGKNSNFQGPPNAKITIVEFSDYQCPACVVAHPTIKKILAANKNKIRFVYRHFPLPQHEFAKRAAEAAEAAGAQGKFWEMHDMLFENQNSLKEEDLIKYAKAINLDLDTFKKDLDSHKFESYIQEDLTSGNNLGINSTPTFYLNGEKLQDFPSVENLQQRINRILQSS